jgi:hypothetical protein
MSDAPKNPLEIAQERGAALLDNSTIVGVEAALREPRHATTADTQSFACVLEALVLHESLAADTWGDSEDYPPVLFQLQDLRDANHIFTTFSHISSVPDASGPGSGSEVRDFATSVVEDSLDRLERALRPEGGLDRQHELLVQRLGSGSTVSTLFREPRDLHNEILDLLFGENLPNGENADLSARIQSLEADIALRLRDVTEDRRLYAMYLLRAFYYEELATAFSLSYAPHTYRADALLALAGGRGGPPSWMFHRYATQLAASARNQLAEQLDLKITVDAPPIASWIAHDVSSRSELLPRALELRATEPATAFRRWITEHEGMLQQERGLPHLRQAQRELEEIVAEIGVELVGNKRSGGHPITLKLTTGLPEVSGEVSTDVVLHSPSWLKRALHRRRPHLTFFSQMTRQLLSGDVVPFDKRLRQLPYR